MSDYLTPMPEYFDTPAAASIPCGAGQHSGCRVVRCGCQCHSEPEAVAWSLQREMLANLPQVVEFVLEGEPVSKARARFTGKGSASRAYTPEKTREAEQKVAWAARSAGVRQPRDDVSFGVFCKFFCGTWQRRDVDNMTKLVLDGLNGIVWKDDVQVSEISASVQRGVDDPRTHIYIYETIASLPPTRPCEVCGTPVRQYKSQPNRFCSKAHSDEGQRRRVDLTCLECGIVYALTAARASRVKKPYCSPACRYRGEVVVKPCEVCAVEVRRPRSQSKNHIFCSVACANRSKRMSVA